MSNLTPVSAADIRQAARDGLFTPAEGVSPASLFGKNSDGKVRGRLNPAHVKAFLASPAGKGKTYSEKSVAEARSVDVTLTRRDKNGKSRGKVIVTVPMAEARTLAGAPAKGRLSKTHQAALTKRLEADRGW